MLSKIFKLFSSSSQVFLSLYHFLIISSPLCCLLISTSASDHLFLLDSSPAADPKDPLTLLKWCLSNPQSLITPDPKKSKNSCG